jgi:hypothetical protein
MKLINPTTTGAIIETRQGVKTRKGLKRFEGDFMKAIHYIALILASLAICSTAAMAQTPRNFRTADGDIIFRESGEINSVKANVNVKVFANNGSYLYNFSARFSSNVGIAYLVNCKGGGEAGITTELGPNRTATVIYSKTNRPGQTICSRQDFQKPFPRTVIVNQTGQDSYTLDFYTSDMYIGIAGGAIDLAEDFKGPTGQMSFFLKTALEKLDELNAGISKADFRHLERLRMALRNAVADLSDEKGNAKYSVTDVRVQEHSRLIMVLSTVLKEILLVNYDHVEGLKPAIEFLRNLSAQLRLAYGWNESLAGTASKALASLGVLVDLEIRDLYYDMGAFGETGLSALNSFMSINHRLINRVRAANGGDASINDITPAYQAAWNNRALQAIISRIMNGGPDISGKVQVRLKLLLMAIESISQLTQTQLNIPDDKSPSTPVANKP